MIKYFLLMLIILIIIGCQDKQNNVTPNISENLLCSQDSDCAAADCCHAKSCVNQNFKKDCSGRFCTMNCEPGTLDCGQGICACQNKQCVALIGQENTKIANPASVYCEKQGNKLEIRSDEKDNQYGVCIFPDGSECDEWKYFRGEC
jgi:putative hemolysin